MKSDRYRSSVIVSMLVAVWLPAAGAQAAIRYVALEGSGANGQSWATAYRNIQAAIDDPAMTDGGEVHVKKGTYLVTTAIDVDKAIKVFGGYSGEGETRAWEVYQTIIDGNGEASHGFRVTANAQIDGFAVIHGKGWGWMANGGGIAVAYCSATVSHCMIYGNRSTGWGGGLATTEAHGTKIANCTFQKNTCSYGGAGIYNENSNNVQITDCQFIENAADADGGGIHNLGSNATITGCTFQANRCAEAIMGYGGGIMNDQSAAIVTNCTFTGGMDADGIRLDTSGITVGPGNTFIGWIQNGYSVHVDAIQVYGGNSLTITGNYFRGNTINFGCYDSGDTVVVTNNIYDLPDLADSGHQDFQLSLTNARFEHNTFYHCLFAVGSKSGDPACTGWVVRNNIYVSTDMIATASAGGTPGFTGTSSYHLKDSASSLTPAGTNIITGSPTFIGGAHPATWVGWQLAAGSLGKNAGSDGADMGSTYYGSNENIPPIGTLSLSVR